MQILRLPPYPLSVTYDVPEATTAYKVIIKDHTSNVDVFDVETITSTSESKITFDLDGLNLYDESYHVEIFKIANDEIVVQDTLEIKRPYVNPASLGTTATEIAEYTQYEMIARAIIDSFVPGGFYYKLEELEAIGQGTDYLPIWVKPYRLMHVHENSTVVYDVDHEDGPAIFEWNYYITDDDTAISKFPAADLHKEDEPFNRSERKRARMALAASDSVAMYDTEDSTNTLTVQPGVLFPEGWDYKIGIEAGYKVVPLDVKEAAKMLINDIKCGKLDYYKRYITNYSTDQFRVQIDKSSLSGTGNLLVDKILTKYITDIGKPGVL